MDFAMLSIRACEEGGRRRMSHRQSKPWMVWVLFLALLVGPSLACAQAGEILSSEEATARARAAVTPTSTRPSVTRAEFQAGDEVEFAGSGFLVPLYKKIGDSSAFSHAGRGDTGTVLGSQEQDGQIWYLVDGPSGEGWVEADALKPVGEASEEPQVGDTVYLTGKSYLISLVAEPGAMRMIAGQERGTQVVIVEMADHEGETWYRIDAPTGEGWVKAENIATEKP
jgi:hypothetical protein